jgi:hypothetical protein
MPDTSFMSVGSSEEVEQDRLQLSDRITALVDGVELVRVVDRDSKSDSEIATAQADGVRVLRRRNLECYLLDDEVLAALCSTCGHPQHTASLILARDEAMAYAVENHNTPPDDYKRVRGDTVAAARRLLAITQGGNSADGFLRDTLSPLLRPGMVTYEELRMDVFGGPPN